MIGIVRAKAPAPCMTALSKGDPDRALSLQPPRREEATAAPRPMITTTKLGTPYSAYTSTMPQWALFRLW